MAHLTRHAAHSRLVASCAKRSEVAGSHVALDVATSGSMTNKEIPQAENNDETQLDDDDTDGLNSEFGEIQY